MTRVATATNAAPSASSIPQTNWPIPVGNRTSLLSSGSSAASTPAIPRPDCCATPLRQPSTSRTRRSSPPAPPRPSVRTGRSRTPCITAVTSPWVRIARASASTQACSPACVVSPSTSSRQIEPTLSARIATAPASQTSKTCLECSLFHSVEQTWPGRSGSQLGAPNAASTASSGVISVRPNRIAYIL